MNFSSKVLEVISMDKLMSADLYKYWDMYMVTWATSDFCYLCLILDCSASPSDARSNKLKSMQFISSFILTGTELSGTDPEVRFSVEELDIRQQSAVHLQKWFLLVCPVSNLSRSRALCFLNECERPPGKDGFVCLLSQMVFSFSSMQRNTNELLTAS